MQKNNVTLNSISQVIVIIFIAINGNVILGNRHLESSYDVTILGEANIEGSLTRFGINLIEMLHPECQVNFVRTPRRSGKKLDNIKANIKNIINKQTSEAGKVLLLAETLGNPRTRIYNKIPSNIKIAYSMLESTKIPQAWVSTLNNGFDAVVVPDDYLVQVYKKSGVKIPIFVIPYCMNLIDFTNQPLKKAAHEPFCFGVSATFIARKNNEKLLNAFIKEFGNNSHVCLKMQGRYGSTQALKRKIKQYAIKNIAIIDRPISQPEYMKFMQSIDCYINISKGEGFSLTPREAMALGIPVIVTNNSAQKTICQTGLVEVVESNIKRPFFFAKKIMGTCFDCRIQDVQTAMRNVYENYGFYLQRASTARSWVQQYDLNKLAPIYRSLVKPKKIFLGYKNKVTRHGIETTSHALYNKYMTLMKQK